MRLPADDPGMASERTALAWLRVAAPHATLGAVMIAGAARHGDFWPYVVAIAAVACNVAVLVWCAGSSYRGRRRSGLQTAAAGPTAAVVGATTVVAATVAALLTLVAAR